MTLINTLAHFQLYYGKVIYSACVHPLRNPVLDKLELKKYPGTPTEKYPGTLSKNIIEVKKGGQLAH